MLNIFLQLFQPYYASAADHERLRAVDATLRVLTVYFEHATDFALGVSILYLQSQIVVQYFYH